MSGDGEGIGLGLGFGLGFGLGLGFRPEYQTLSPTRQPPGSAGSGSRLSSWQCMLTGPGLWANAIETENWGVTGVATVDDQIDTPGAAAPTTLP